MQEKFSIRVQSEIGELEGVIIHQPGSEIENMTPGNAERALYSDILNREVADKGYRQFSGVLSRMTRVFYVQELLADILADEAFKARFITTVCRHEKADHLVERLQELTPVALARQLIEGVALERDNLSRFLSEERYALRPLHNFFFTRDAAVALSGQVLIGRMANPVRDREALIVEAIFSHHPRFSVPTHTPLQDPENRQATIEGGDILVARKDLLLIGSGSRTSSAGIDFIIDLLKKQKSFCEIIVQQLPRKPESFIHLDMIFTLLDRHHCMIYEPIVRLPNPYRTVRIAVDNGKVRISEEENLLKALEKAGMELEPILCGGSEDAWVQQREQWHSGANFFALGPGRVIGYDRNVHTLAELARNGYEIIKASDVIRNKVKPEAYRRCVVTVDGSELARGGGGCRCMTMPLSRRPL